jgi:putative heme-binding domain-containing protein
MPKRFFPLLLNQLTSRLCLLAVAMLVSPAFATAEEENSIGIAQTFDSTRFPGAAEPTSPAEWYGAGVRPTEARTPEEELAGFRLAPGFEIRLFAAEPQIAKPMNLAMDVRGRLWVTDSYEYPYAAPTGKTPGDAVRVLEDTNNDGRADKVTVFADQLNIPIGVLPYGDGCICFSIPNLYYLRDTDGDGVCDRRDVILGPFDTSRDTHGMINSLRMGADGWVYANHGFNNQSRVAGRDGHEIQMISGNTFRFRPDGSRVEQVTWGQVNPFGRAEDDWGYPYTADCHSKPVSQLIRDGYYPSFGRPDDGLGFVPPMMDHLHGSTAISGLVYLSPDLALAGYDQQMLSGNVMTSRLNRNYVEYRGATAVARELPDFLTSDDPWFRPVDIRLGSDGFLYVADFYNRIIGHYEVPLEHPGRDRFRGRIWQIRPTATTATPKDDTLLAGPSNLQVLADEALVKEWASGNATRRSLALEEAIRRESPRLDAWAEQTGITSPNHHTRINAMWYLYRRQQLTVEHAASFANDASPQVRTQWLRLLAEDSLNDELRAQRLTWATAALQDENPHVVRAAAEAIGNCRESQILGNETIAALLTQLAKAPAQDPILRQSLRIALRNLLRDRKGTLTNWADSVMAASNSQAQHELAEVASLALSIRNEEVGQFIAKYLARHGKTEANSLQLLKHAITCLPPDGVEPVIATARELASTSLSTEREMVLMLAIAMQDRGPHSPGLQAWATELTTAYMDQVHTALAYQRPLAVAWQDERGQNWPVQTRLTVAGEEVQVTSSFPLGENYTGRLISEPFPAPEEIRFWLAGHNGHPDQPDTRRNRIELVDAETGQVLLSEVPPRRDQVKVVIWECQAFKGRSVRLECVDGDGANAFAWLAFGGLQPQWLNPSGSEHPLTAALQLIATFRLSDFQPQLLELLAAKSLSISRRAAIGQYLAQSQNQPLLSVMFQQLIDPISPLPLPDTWLNAIHPANSDSADNRSSIQATFDARLELHQLAKQLTQDGQRDLALSLATNRELISPLIDAMEEGALSPQVLLDKEVSNRAQALATPQQWEKFTALQSLAKPTDAAIEASMQTIVSALQERQGDSAQGLLVFRKHCAACHQLQGEGQVVGPQLDGTGGRGALRLLEDIALPDRNVDRAFRTTTFITTDGRAINGLIRSENETVVTIVGNDGKPIELNLDDIEVRREGNTSLMPGNFHQTLQQKEFVDLLQFLLSNATAHKQTE